jgi:hypothetical protein
MRRVANWCASRRRTCPASAKRSRAAFSTRLRSRARSCRKTSTSNSASSGLCIRGGLRLRQPALTGNGGKTMWPSAEAKIGRLPPRCAFGWGAFMSDRRSALRTKAAQSVAVSETPHVPPGSSAYLSALGVYGFGAIELIIPQSVRPSARSGVAEVLRPLSPEAAICRGISALTKGRRDRLL